MSVTKCRSMKDQLEHWNFHMHRSYIISELCRPTLASKKKSSHLQKDQQDLEKSLRSKCIKNLALTVEAFLGLHNVTKFAAQSWAAIHRSLSSALLLGILGEPRQNDHVRMLLLRLYAVMQEVDSDLDPSEKSAPITRSLEALAKFTAQNPNDEPSVMSNSVTPFEFGETLFYSSTPGSASTNSATTGASYSPTHTSEGERNSPLSMLNSIIWGSNDNALSGSSGDGIFWT